MSGVHIGEGASVERSVLGVASSVPDRYFLSDAVLADGEVAQSAPSDG